MITEQEIKSQADEIAYGHQVDCLEAETLLAEIVSANRQPTYAEATYFQQRLGWDESQQKKQWRRMSSVLRFKSICGTPADRAAAMKEAETAAMVLETESPKLEQKISDLQAKLRSLESDARLSARRVEDQAEAVTKLRELCPQAIADQVRATRNELDHTLGREIADAKSRIHELECCLTPDRYPTPAEHVEGLYRSFPDAVLITVSNGYQRKSLSAQWPNIKVECEFERAELKAKLEKLQTQYNAELAKIESPLNYYATGVTE